MTEPAGGPFARRPALLQPL